MQYGSMHKCCSSLLELSALGSKQSNNKANWRLNIYMYYWTNWYTQKRCLGKQNPIQSHDSLCFSSFCSVFQQGWVYCLPSICACSQFHRFYKQFNVCTQELIACVASSFCSCKFIAEALLIAASFGRSKYGKHDSSGQLRSNLSIVTD